MIRSYSSYTKVPPSSDKTLARKIKICAKRDDKIVESSLKSWSGQHIFSRIKKNGWCAFLWHRCMPRFSQYWFLRSDQRSVRTPRTCPNPPSETRPSMVSLIRPIVGQPKSLQYFKSLLQLCFYWSCILEKLEPSVVFLQIGLNKICA